MTENRGEHKGEFITEEMDYATVARFVSMVVRSYGKYLRKYDPLTQKHSMTQVRDAMSEGLADRSGYGPTRKGTL